MEPAWVNIIKGLRIAVENSSPNEQMALADQVAKSIILDSDFSDDSKEIFEHLMNIVGIDEHIIKIAVQKHFAN